ncbi:MAG: family 16 glycosylhydrolase [Acidobacteriota bacterium]|nr:family 16 glycosylhydrolase [Acidobacteriota bacterium]
MTSDRLIQPLMVLWMTVLVTPGCAIGQTGWRLVWSDEFNASAGSPPDPANWNYDIGQGWSEGDLETYTSSARNIFHDGQGNLVIRVIRDSSGRYTSARLQSGSPGASTRTADHSWQYGLIEARMKLPFGLGVWPAFWMLGEDIGTTPWPQSGEIDIMENYGPYHNNASIIHGSAHGPGYTTGAITAAATLRFGETVSDDYHVYAIQWSRGSIEFFLDGTLYNTITPSSMPAGGTWVFEAPFFILLNVAVGGPSTFLGTPDANLPFPNQDLVIDYVRVYQPIDSPAGTPVINPGSIVNAASWLGDLAPGSLAVLYGSNLADGTYNNTVGPGSNFVTSIGTTTVTVAGTAAPLIYVAPGQINFQIPWETKPGTAIPVQVSRGPLSSAPETLTMSVDAAPSMFLQDLVRGIAWMTGAQCATSECRPTAGVTYQLWANGLGPRNTPSSDGVPARVDLSTDLLEVAGGRSACQLTIGGVTAQITYCGAAPGLIIDQVNFIYPAGVASTQTYVQAALTVNGTRGLFRVPAP